jgi:hypothetical protein
MNSTGSLCKRIKGDYLINYKSVLASFHYCILVNLYTYSSQAKITHASAFYLIFNENPLFDEPINFKSLLKIAGLPACEQKDRHAAEY